MYWIKAKPLPDATALRSGIVIMAVGESTCRWQHEVNAEVATPECVSILAPESIVNYSYKK